MESSPITSWQIDGETVTMFKIGHEQKLKQDDMYSVFPEDRSQRLGEELQG